MGETVAGRPLSHHGDAGRRGGRAEQLRHHERRRGFHDQPAAGDVDDEPGEQDLRGSGPESADDGERDGFLVADGVTATYSRAVGETVLGGPYHITATLTPGGAAEQLRDHERGGELLDHRAAGDVDDESGEQDLGGCGPEPADRRERDLPAS